MSTPDELEARLALHPPIRCGQCDSTAKPIEPEPGKLDDFVSPHLEAAIYTCRNGFCKWRRFDLLRQLP